MLRCLNGFLVSWFVSLVYFWPISRLLRTFLVEAGVLRTTKSFGSLDFERCFESCKRLASLRLFSARDDHSGDGRERAVTECWSCEEQRCAAIADRVVGRSALLLRRGAGGFGAHEQVVGLAPLSSMILDACDRFLS